MKVMSIWFLILNFETYPLGGGGGLKNLRAKFEAKPSGHIDSPEMEELDLSGSSNDEEDYFNHGKATHSGSLTQSVEFASKTPKQVITDLPKQQFSSPEPMTATELPTPSSTSRLNSLNVANPGDLHSMAGGSDGLGPFHAENNVINMAVNNLKNIEKRAHSTSRSTIFDDSLSSDDFDLRTEVMGCIARSIGLLQPPTDGDSDSSPGGATTSGTGGPFSPGSSDAGTHALPQVFNSSFGSLSMLEADLGLDDTASTTSASASTFGNHPLMGLDNEVEILSFDAGTTLVMAGERNAGAFSQSQISQRDYLS